MKTLDYCFETRLTIGLQRDGEHSSETVIVREFEAEIGRVIVLTPPEKSYYVGAPLPEILPEVVASWSQLQSVHPESISWFCHFNKASAFEIENAFFEAEFYRVEVEGTGSGAFASLGRRISPQELARTIGISAALLYSL